MDRIVIKKISLFQYQLPLIRPLTIKNNILQHRAGLILVLLSEQGQQGWGEISPLPGLHQEKLSEIKSVLTDCLHDLKNISSSPSDMIKLLPSNRISGIEKLPSVQFGLDSAWLDLFAKVRCEPVYRLLGKESEIDAIRVNGLVTREQRERIKIIKQMLLSGYRSIKIKVGTGPESLELSEINRICNLLGNKVKFRLDANRSWTFEQALDFTRHLDRKSIEYIEEPLQDPAKLYEFYLKTGIPVALDESIIDLSEINDLPDWIKAVILKPTLLGGISRNLSLIWQAAKYNIPVILSDTFQSGIGLLMVANLAALTGGSDLAMGLDTYQWLQEDIIEPRLEYRPGKLLLPSTGNVGINLDMQKLNPVITI